MLRCALVIALAASACGLTPVSPDARVQQARGYAVRYFEAIEGSAGDRGWSLLHPETRLGFEDNEQYVAFASAADWGAFDWSFAAEGPAAYCDDLVLCHLPLDVTGGEQSVPDFLRRAPRQTAGGGLAILAPTGNAPGSGALEITIAFDRLTGSASVWFAHV